MFSIRLQLDDFPSIHGLDALDWRRRLGLSDGTALYRKKQSVLRYDVDEAFARAWFGPSMTERWATIKLDWLAPDDVEEDGPCIALSAKMDTRRALDLYVRYRFEQLRSELAVAFDDVQSPQRAGETEAEAV